MIDMDDSHQEGRVATAPYNPNPRWPTGYFEVLDELGIPERVHSFFAHWVRQFFSRHPGQREEGPGSG